jgi:hypothetical protein
MMACFDERGRLFLAESAGLNWKRDDLLAKPPNSIRVLEPADATPRDVDVQVERRLGSERARGPDLVAGGGGIAVEVEEDDVQEVELDGAGRPGLGGGIGNEEPLDLRPR